MTSETPEPVRCPHCDAPNPAGAASCSECGMPLPAPAAQSGSRPAWLPPAALDAETALPAPPPPWLPPAPAARPPEPVEPPPGWLPGREVPSASAGGNSTADAPTADAVPGWLAGLPAGGDEPQPEGGEQAPAMPQAGIPAWLAELEAAGGEPAAAPGEADDEDAEIGWLEELSAAVAAEEEPVEEDDAPPDWIKELGQLRSGSQAGRAPAPEPPAPEAESALPSWLAESLAGDDAPTGAPAQQQDDEPPDWLAAAQVEAGDEPEGQPGDGATMPEWLQQARELEGAEAEPGSAAPARTNDTPDWLRGSSDLAVAEDEAALSPPAGEDMPDWLRGVDFSAVAAAPGEADAPPAPEAEATPADALGDAGQEGRPAGSAPAAPGAEPDLDWLQGFDFEDELGLAEAGPGGAALDGEDLLGFSGSLLEPAEPPDAEPGEGEALPAAPGELPAWLRAGPEGVVEPAPGGEDLLDRIQGLRFTAIAGEEPADGREAGVETVGALKHVTGVIQPELIFEGSTLAVDEPVQELIVTPGDLEQVALVERLLAEEAQPPGVQGRRRALPVLRWLVAVLLIAAAGVPLLPGADGAALFPEPRGGQNVGAFYGVLEEAAQGGARVLIAFEYEPDTAAEMQPLAGAVLSHLLRAEGARVYAVSTRPLGPAMAEAAREQEDVAALLAGQQEAWTNLGYLPGRAVGINSLVNGAPAGARPPFAADAAGQPTGLGARDLEDLGVDLIVVLAARPEDVQVWIEQAGALAGEGQRMVAAVSQRALPAAQPYVASGQLAGTLSGLSDAAAYRALLGGPPPAALTTRLNAQMVAAGAAALLIVLGGVFFGLSSLRQQQEQAR